jgi:phage gp29-like protein
MTDRIYNRMKSQLNRALATVSMRFHVMAANLWRDSYNPLRGLTIRRAVDLLEAGERGAYAELQWTYRFIEMQDAVLGAIIERRVAAIKKLNWNIKLRNGVPDGEKQIAEQQQAALKEFYDNINNLKASWEAMVMASFRGFALLEKVRVTDGSLVELAVVPQWYWVREGLNGAWEYNEGAKFGTMRGTLVDLNRFVVREIARPINRVALVAFVRKGLSQKDWDGFVETFGIPAVFLIMPPNVPKEKEAEYLATADDVVSNARGVLPHGSDVKTVDNGARGVNPFKDHITYQDEQMILRGTGGKLTMLTAATGLNSNQGDVHQDAFDDIAIAEAAEISELYNEQLTAPFFAERFPGQRVHVYFEIAANEETDSACIVKDVIALKSGGYVTSAEFIAEKTGYPVTAEAVATAPAPIPSSGSKILNRSGEEQKTGTGLFDALRAMAESAIVAGYHDAQKTDNQTNE